MARRVGITQDDVARATIEHVDEHGFEALTVAGVATRLGVQPPSLYHHVDGVAALRRIVIEEAIAILAEATRRAREGRHGEEAFVAHAVAQRDLARRRPGLYAAINATALIANDPPLWEKLLQALAPMADTLRELGLPEAEVLEGLRLLRASMHGFLVLELRGDFGFDLDVERSYERLIDVVLTGLRDTLS